MPDVGIVLKDLIGSSGDLEVIEYIVGVLEDDSFEFGPDAEDAFEAFGEMLVGAGCAASDADAHDLCRRLQAALHLADSNSNTNNKQDEFRALEGGPVVMNSLTDQVYLHPSDSFSGKHLIQGVFREGDADDFSLMNDKDAAKIRRQKEKAERAQAAVLEAHRTAVAEALAGHAIEVVRHVGGPAVRDIHLRSISVSNGGAELISDADVVFAHGRKYGLVGRNGTGKTTLLRALAGRHVAGIPVNCQVLHVEQEIVGDGISVIQAVLQCDTERTRLLQEEAALMADSSATTASAQLEQISKRLIEIDAYGAEARAAAILAGLSFDQDMQHVPTSSLSGGWRMRVALARALFVEPDLLLLDEPTNHLDLHAVLWLQDYLVKWPKTVVVVSHARQFLNVVCTDIMYLQNRTITTYRGNYDVFEKTAKERARCARAAAESVAARRAHMQAFIDRFRYNANRAALVQSRIKALERMEEVSLAIDDPEYHFCFPAPPDPVAPPIIAFNDVSFAYPNSKQQIFTDLNFGLDCDSRAAIVGPNGIGKSTLLGLISGTLAPTRGHISRNAKVRLAIFSQHHVDGLDLASTALQYFASCFPDAKEPAHRSHLASFGVGPDLAAQAMYTLSGGQKSRVALARVTWTKPHILLLDEPSNHLDIDAVDALIAGLAAFKGGVLMVSHDQYLIEATVDELWAVEGGRVTPFHGTFEEYKRGLTY